MIIVISHYGIYHYTYGKSIINTYGIKNKEPDTKKNNKEPECQQKAFKIIYTVTAGN